jgi:hypothetical protein
MRFVSLRGLGLGLMAGAFLLSAAAASADAPAAVVGQVTCGADEATPAAHISVVAVGLEVRTLTDSTGRFELADLPSGQPLTLEAISDPQASLVVSRGSLVLQPGEVLDMGSMDLPVCGQPAAPQSDQDVSVVEH